LDESALPGVSVSATSPELFEPRSALTDREGRFSFGDLPDGTYTFRFTLPGFVEATHPDIVLPAAAGSPLDVVMRVRSLGETTTILRGPRRGTPFDPQVSPPPEATCSMRVIPVDPSIDRKMLEEPDDPENHAIRIVPPPCRASHPAPSR
jgi:hypothetical protein